MLPVLLKVVREGISDKRMFEQCPVGSQVRNETFSYLGKECSSQREEAEHPMQEDTWCAQDQSEWEESRAGGYRGNAGPVV